MTNKKTKLKPKSCNMEGWLGDELDWAAVTWKVSNSSLSPVFLKGVGCWFLEILSCANIWVFIWCSWNFFHFPCGPFLFLSLLSTVFFFFWGTVIWKLLKAVEYLLLELQWQT
jgi:hypothetical protein